MNGDALTRPRRRSGRAAAVVVVAGLGLVAAGPSGVNGAPENDLDRLDSIGQKASQQFERGFGIEPLTIVVSEKSYELSGGDGAGGVMFGGVGARCNTDDTAFVYTPSGEPSSVWPDAVRVARHWFRTRQCLPEGIE